MTKLQNESSRGTMATYVSGFILSVVLTLAAYFIVLDHVDSGHEKYTHSSIITALIALALTQFVVQAIFFLHLGRESKPRWNLTVFAFMIIVVSTVVIGSLWIMNNLNYQHVHPKSGKEADTYIIEDELIKTDGNDHNSSDNHSR